MAFKKTSADIAKVFYKLAWMENNSSVITEFLRCLENDYSTLYKDPELEGADQCREIAKMAKALRTAIDNF